MGLTESSWNWPKYVNGNMMVDQKVSYSAQKQEAEFDRGNMGVHSKGVSGVLFFQHSPLDSCTCNRMG